MVGYIKYYQTCFTPIQSYTWHPNNNCVLVANMLHGQYIWPRGQWPAHVASGQYMRP